MTLEEAIKTDSFMKPSSQPSNSVLKEHENNPLIKKLFSRSNISLKDNLPDNLIYEKPAGAATWKESHFVFMQLPGNVKVHYVLKAINKTVFAKQFGANAALSDDDLMVKELLGGNSASLEGLAYAVPVKLKDGTLAMLEEVLPESIENKTKSYLTIESLEELIGHAKGLRSLHRDLNRVWGDGKPEHFRYDLKGKPKLNDFGTTSILNSSLKNNKRTGDFLYSAPETFSRLQKDKSIDVFSFGAVTYYFFTGEDVNKELFDTVTKGISSDKVLAKFEAYTNFMKTVSDGKLSNYYKKKSRNLPKKFRKLFLKMVAPDSYKRISDGIELVDVLEEFKQGLDAKAFMKKQVQKHSGVFLIGGILAATIALGAYSMHKAPVMSVQAPKVVVGEPVNLPKDAVRFDVEKNFKEQTRNIPNLESTTYNANWYNRSNIKTYQALVIAMGYDYAKKINGGLKENLRKRISFRDTQLQSDKYRQVTNMYSQPRDEVAELAQHNLGILSDGTGVVDFEDLHVRCVLSKEEYSTLQNVIKKEVAKGNVNAYNFSQYKYFKKANGKTFFNKREIKFLDLWINCSYQTLLHEKKNLVNLFDDNSKEYYIKQKKAFEQHNPLLRSLSADKLLYSEK